MTPLEFASIREDVVEGGDRPADPIVAVIAPVVESTVLRDLLVVSCSECGDVTDWSSPDPGDSEKNRLRRTARDHANEAHDGLVHAVGWART